MNSIETACGFKKIDRWSMPKQGDVVDIARGGSFCFWHVRVVQPPLYTERPYNLPPKWCEITFDDGKFSESLYYAPAFVRIVEESHGQRS